MIDFSADLLAWYDEHQRVLPWRSEPNPYYVWLSEIMLQQTRVETALPYFQRFLARFPEVRALAEAPEADVLKAWEGLGYYSRARHLQAAAKVIAAEGFPSTRDEWLKLPGIGDYSAGAIASIAFNEPVPAVDGNVLRVFARLKAIDEPIDGSKAKKAIASLVLPLIPPRAGDFNQAIMELGARVCLPQNPACISCPVARHCEASQRGEVERYPLKGKKKPPRSETWLMAVIERGGEFLVRRRPTGGLLGGLHEFPWVLSEELPGESALLGGLAHQGLQLTDCRPLVRVTHSFSHIRAEVHSWTARLVSGEIPDCRWVSLEDFGDLAWTKIGILVRAALEEALNTPMLPGLQEVSPLKKGN